jgi:hypothetical protein
VFNFAQTGRIDARKVSRWGAGNGWLPMNDAQRYRLNAAECLSAASTSNYRGQLFCIATSWLDLARQEETIRDLFVSWGIPAPAHETDTNADLPRQRA